MIRVVVLAVAVGAVAVIAPKYLARVGEAQTVAETVAVARAPIGEPPSAYLERRAVLQADSAGHYTANAVINGRPVDVLVDTGATTVAISSETARRLGLSVPNSAFTVPVDTANGRVMAAAVTLDEVRIGEVSVRHVGALVLPADILGTSLLGMTFLNGLQKFESAGARMILTQ